MMWFGERGSHPTLAREKSGVAGDRMLGMAGGAAGGGVVDLDDGH